MKMTDDLIKKNVEELFQSESGADSKKVFDIARKNLMGNQEAFLKNKIHGVLMESRWCDSEFAGINKGVVYNQTITLIRGLPGDGKTTKAMTLKGKHVEADMFFDKNGEYCFEGRKIKDAHIWCQAQAKYYLNQGEDVVVSNTFVRIEEMKPYIDASREYGASLQIIECSGNYKSVHDVPVATIENMRRKWEKLPDDLKVYMVANQNPVISSACVSTNRV